MLAFYNILISYNRDLLPSFRSSYITSLGVWAGVTEYMQVSMLVNIMLCFNKRYLHHPPPYYDSISAQKSNQGQGGPLGCSQSAKAPTLGKISFSYYEYLISHQRS